MEASEDPLRRYMRVERVERDDGRKVLLYTWPSPSAHGEPGASAERRLDPWSPESGPADV